MERGNSNSIAYDLEKTPLQFSTDSPEGMIVVIFHDMGVRLRIESPKYRFLGCGKYATALLTPLPNKVKKIWQITKLPGPRMIVQCNGKVILDFVMLNETCKWARWSEYWNADVKRIRFGTEDTASDFYRPVSGMKKL